MSEDAEKSRMAPASTRRGRRLYWLPALLAALLWLCYLYVKAHGGPEGQAALSGAVPNHDLEWIGLMYLAARLARTLIAPGLLIGAIILWLWEEAEAFCRRW